MKIFLLIFIIFLPIHAHGASFDCNKAQNPTEKKICENKAIGELDKALNSYYTDIRSKLTSEKKSFLKDNQISWLHTRNKCLSDQYCLFYSYQKRIQDLIYKYSDDAEYKYIDPTPLDQSYFEKLHPEYDFQNSPRIKRILFRGVKPIKDYLGEFSFRDIDKVPIYLGMCFTEQGCSDQIELYKNGRSTWLKSDAVISKYEIFLDRPFNPDFPKNRYEDIKIIAIAKADFDHDGYSDILYTLNGYPAMFTATNVNQKIYGRMGNTFMCKFTEMELNCDISDFKKYFSND